MFMLELVGYIVVCSQSIVDKKWKFFVLVVLERLLVWREVIRGDFLKDFSL